VQLAKIKDSLCSVN